MNLSTRVKAIQEKINLEKKFGTGAVDLVDDVAIVTIGGAKEDAEDTPVAMAAAATVATLLTYEVPTGKKAILLKIRCDKTKIGTDKAATFQICDDTTSKIEAFAGVDIPFVEEESPIHDYEFAAGVTIKLQAVTEAGAVGVFYAMKATFLVVPA